MLSLSSKIAYRIIIAGFFVMAAFLALNYQYMSPEFYFVCGALVTYLLFFSLAIGQQFAAPIKKLSKRANDLGRGNLKGELYSQSKDEIEQLSNALNKIADQLEEVNAEKERIKQLVGIKVEAKTHELEEVIGALERKVINKTLELQRLSSDMAKMKEFAGTKESELAALKDQMLKINNKLEKNGSKNRGVAT